MMSGNPSASPITRIRALADGFADRFMTFVRDAAKKSREDIERKRDEEQAAARARAKALRRPPGWAGHWSARYGEVLARTLQLDPPFSQPQRELLAAIPRPLSEALDPAASAAELIDRDGNLVAWRVQRSPLFDLFGPLGFFLGALALAIALFNYTRQRLELPPLVGERPRATVTQPPQVQQPLQVQRPLSQTEQPQAQQPQTPSTGQASKPSLEPLLEKQMREMTLPAAPPMNSASPAAQSPAPAANAGQSPPPQTAEPAAAPTYVVPTRKVGKIRPSKP